MISTSRRKLRTIQLKTETDRDCTRGRVSGPCRRYFGGTDRCGCLPVQSSCIMDMKKKKGKGTGLLKGMAIICVVLAFILAVLLIVGRSGRTGRKAASASISSASVSSAAAMTSAGREAAASDNQESGQIEGEDDATPADSAAVRLTDADIHKGDLILVNPWNAYDFDANADSVDLVNILDNQSVTYPCDKSDFEIARHVLPHLDEMIAACNAAVGTNETSISSAYRSMDYQQNVWNETVANYGEAYARNYVAVPGYSEHHTGLAVDLGRTASDGTAESFTGSANADWINTNSWRYGFIRRYAEDKASITGCSNESWHYRYVGVPHAYFMYANNLCLEEYIEWLRENTSESAPYTITCDLGTWEVYFTQSRNPACPDEEYNVSGNNVDGYVITVKKN